MQVPCSFEFNIISLTFRRCPKGQIRFSLQRGEKSHCTKVYKCSSEIIINQKLNLKTTLKSTTTKQYQKKEVYLRFFFRDENKQLIKYKKQFNIGEKRGNEEEELNISMDGVNCILKYIVKLTVEKVNRVSIEFNANTLPLNQNNIIQNKNFFTNGTILSQTSNNSVLKQNKTIINELNQKVKTLQIEISILKQQLRLQQQMNTSRFCDRGEDQRCTNPICYEEKQKLLASLGDLQKVPTTIQIDRMKAIQINQQQTILQLRQELESSLKYQQLNKKLQIDLSNLDNKMQSLQKQFKDSKKYTAIKIQQLQARKNQLQVVESELVKAKMLTMSLWNSIQEKGGSKLFDQISSDILQ